jgi:hypothetical protein
LLEDAMMAYRIVRSPERRAFYIDVGNIPPQDVEQYMQKAMTQMKRNQVVDPDTGRVDLRYNPLSVEEDYFIPVRGGTSGTKIESIAGGKYTGDIDDVKYLRDKLFSALKIPASYLSSDAEKAQEDKTTLAQKDIRFARTVQRLQRSIITELEKVGIIHLYTLGYREEDLIYDRRFEAALETAAEVEQAAATAPGGELAGDLEDPTVPEGEAELGVPTDAPTAALGAQPEIETATEPEAAEGDLLAAPPAKRDDTEKTEKREAGKTKTTTAKSHGWYEPRSNKPGGDRRKSSGPRKKNMSRAASPEFGTYRKTLPGASELSQLVKGTGIYESKLTTYSREEEEKLLKNQEELKVLFENIDIEKRKEKNETEAQ